VIKRLFNLAVASLIAPALAACLSAHAQLPPSAPPPNSAFIAVEAAMSPPDAARQVELTAQAFARLAPQRPGVTDTYVLSLSLWGEPVFENEAKEAAAVLAQRFDAGERTLILSAGRGGGPRTYPLAVPNTISAALGKIGATIDPNEDLVVVFLTSHGAPDGAVAMQEANRMGGALRPIHLRSMLSSAGIRNKVVIVSACFSGHFVLPFSDPYTVLMTAAAADKSSFGCQPERDWTYFGDALFNHKMRSGLGLSDAFDASLDLIAVWEAKLTREWDALPAAQKKQQPRPEPSNPQKHVGEQAAAVLARAERYGLTVGCAGVAGFALESSKAGTPVPGLGSGEQIALLRKDLEARAQQLGVSQQRTVEETSRAISAATASFARAAASEPAAAAAGAAKCITPGN
jgi:hypothetical protein